MIPPTKGKDLSYLVNQKKPGRKRDKKFDSKLKLKDKETNDIEEGEEESEGA